MSLSLAEPRVLVPLQLEPHAEPALGAQLHTLSGATMGTTWRVLALAGDTQPRAWAPAIYAALQLVIEQMSTWLPTSALCRFNAAPAGSWHELPAELRQVLACGLQVAAASNGAFDPAAGELVDLWGFGPGPQHFDTSGFAPPAPADCAAALARGGWQRLRVDGTRVLQPGGLQLDFSGIAKGYAVDLVADTLRGLGVRHCLVEIGGELRGHGLKPDGQPWWVELEAPPDIAHAPVTTRLALHGLAVATSGDYRRFFTAADGRRHAHTLDPRTGAPVAHAPASVSVVHAQCMWADAWSTALTVLGPDDGLALATRAHIAARWLVRRADGGVDERLSPAMLALAQ
ncbi:FAD:protein FMN transferase [Roseateles sp. DC23W]|uniref:FAD:protein FMN transferase n=1 Tax=Pelomonas dachongensis TaxID=3299029 RepID=A0ABW7EI43_9BURK